MLAGEGLAICSQMQAARLGFPWVRNPMALGMNVVGGVLLLVGYVIGLQAYKNIWIVSVLSWTSILLVEPICVMAFFKQLPTQGAVLGGLCGLVGMLCSVFF